MDIKYKRINVLLLPNNTQTELINKSFGCARFVYNYFLALKIHRYENFNQTLTYHKTAQLLTKLKKMEKYEWLQEVNAQSLQQSLKDLDTAYKNFFRRVKKGEKPGFPKFKSKNRSKTAFRVPQGVRVECNYINLPKLGYMRFRGDNKKLLQTANIKSCTVYQEAGRYYASILYVDEAEYSVDHKYQACGIDLGVNNPLTVSYLKDNGTTGYAVIGKKFSKELAKKEKRRKRYQKQYARKQKGSNNSKKSKLKLQKAFKREKDFRKDYIEKASDRLTKKCKIVVFEDLKLKNMTKSAKGTIDNPGTNVKQKSGLNREMLRLGHGLLVKRIVEKANDRGGEVVFIDPKYTSQTCSECGYRSKENRKSQAVFVCKSCGWEQHADCNAANNILDKGLAV